MTKTDGEKDEDDSAKKQSVNGKTAKPGFNPKDPKMKKGDQERLDTILARFRKTAHFDTM